MFIIGNTIVVTLFLKSGSNSNSSLGLGPGPNRFSTDFYTEYAENRVEQANSYSNPDLKTNPNRLSAEFSAENIGNRVKQGNLNSGSDLVLSPNPNQSSACFYPEHVDNTENRGNLNSGPNPNPSEFWSDFQTEHAESRVKQGMGGRKMSRSNSEHLGRDVPHRQLQRSETEVGRGSSVASDGEMSGDEFRLRVEAFIARQQRSLREEEFS